MFDLDWSVWANFIRSFLVGATWVTLVTVIAEKFGSKIGGFIGGLPSTIVVALLFIGLGQSAEESARAAVMIPLVMGVNGIFILIYLSTVRYGLFRALGLALMAWALLNTIIVVTAVENLVFSILGWLILMVVSYTVSEKFMRIESRGGVRVAYTWVQILFRGLISGFIISLAVLISRLAGPVIGGIFSTFPVIFMSTLAITYFTGGVEFSRAVAKTLMLSGMINVGFYAICAHFLIPQMGVWLGTLSCLILSSISAAASYRIIRAQTQ